MIFVLCLNSLPNKILDQSKLRDFEDKLNMTQKLTSVLERVENIDMKRKKNADFQHSLLFLQSELQIIFRAKSIYPSKN